MSVGTEGSGPNPRTYSRADYAALEAELERRKQLDQEALEFRQELIRERDEAIAQLAAIQGGMGEAVEVAAYAVEHPEVGYKVYKQFSPWMIGGEWECSPLMTVAQFQRITAAMAAGVERLREDYDKAWRHAGMNLENLGKALADNTKLRAELDEVKGREAVGEVQLRTGGGISLLHVDLTQPLPPGTKLYALPPASPDVEWLVNELQRIAEKCSDPDTTDALDTALSAWRQAQEGKP